MLETSGLCVAYVRFEDPPGLSPHHHVGCDAAMLGSLTGW
jgi:hypothetical protein